MHFRSKGEGPEGNQTRAQAGRPYLNKPGMPGWERGEEEEEEEAEEEEEGERTFNMSRGPHQ